MKKILVVTPRFPFDLNGACEQDRAHGVKILKNLGYDVHVVTLAFEKHLDQVAKAEQEYGITITPILFTKFRYTKLQKIKTLLLRLPNPFAWDGAAYEFRDTEIQNTVMSITEDWKPDLMWFDYTFLWPLYHIPKKLDLPIITRSINYEPLHFYGGSKKTIVDWIKFQIKKIGEHRAVRESDAVFSITPKEKFTYESLVDKGVTALPLRRLGVFIGKNQEVKDKEVLDIFFMGSSYNITHMRQALELILFKVQPLLQKTFPGKFRLNIIGGKFPEEYREKLSENTVVHGYVPDLDAFLADMDIAISPSLSGQGMQQKVFEPIVRGIPTITTDRALVGYPFYDRVHLRLASGGPEQYVKILGELYDTDTREQLSNNAVTLAKQLFTEEIITQIMKTELDTVFKKYEK